jgi:CDI immunity proteins
MNNEVKKSISQLEGWIWSQDIPDKTNSTYEELKFYQLHNKPINNYSVEDIYFMIGQYLNSGGESGLKYFVPLALVYLNDNLLTEAEDFAGDLLARLLIIDFVFWETNPKCYNLLKSALKENAQLLKNTDLPYDLVKLLRNRIVLFLEK